MHAFVSIKVYSPYSTSCGVSEVCQYLAYITNCVWDVISTQVSLWCSTVKQLSRLELWVSSWAIFLYLYFCFPPAKKMLFFFSNPPVVFKDSTCGSNVPKWGCFYPLRATKINSFFGLLQHICKSLVLCSPLRKKSETKREKFLIF